MSYVPRPIDTSKIQLSPAILELTERLAENAHDHWAKARFSEGWSLGETRDQEKRTTPLLVPYGKLPESEKQYDRNAAMETLKALIALGYKIESQ